MLSDSNSSQFAFMIEFSRKSRNKTSNGGHRPVPEAYLTSFYPTTPEKAMKQPIARQVTR
jgi:hypothetical protein